MIGGATNFDEDEESLLLISQAWTSDASYEDRVDSIQTGLVTDDGSVVRLDQNGENPTITDDGERDRILGQGGVDWYFAEIGSDRIHGKRKNEQIN